ncbi:MAG TPA: hypothetical protein VGQ83_03990, partial [Polyangia bacterium]
PAAPEKAEPPPAPPPAAKASPKPVPPPVAKAPPKPAPPPVAKAPPKPAPPPVAKAPPKPALPPVAKPPKPALPAVAKAPAKTPAPAVAKAPAAPAGRDPARAAQLYADATRAFVGGNFSESVRAYQAALKADSSLTKAYRGLGMSYAKLGSKGPAAKALREYLRRAPKAADAPMIAQRLSELSK